MQTTIAVDGQARAMRATTWLASRRPSPSPPTLVAEARPSNPALPSAVIVSRGKHASRSVRSASGSTVSVTIRARVSSGFMGLSVCAVAGTRREFSAARRAVLATGP
jgi:hypothetical protein